MSERIAFDQSSLTSFYKSQHGIDEYTRSIAYDMLDQG